MTAPRLDNRVILIVGGTSGLGRSAALACHAAGARLVVVGRNREKCRQLAEHVGQRLHYLVGDAAQPQTAEDAVALAVKQYGRLDGLYHVAGGSGRKHGDGPLHEVSDAGWRFTMQCNLDSLFYSNRAAVRQMIAQGEGGTVLNMSSVLAYAPSPQNFATHGYACSKAGAIGLTIACAAYYAKLNIRFNVIAPSLFDTPMAQRAMQDDSILSYVQSKQPLDGGRAGLPEDADQAVLFFLSDASRFVTGQVLAVDGGWSVSEGQIQ